MILYGSQTSPFVRRLRLLLPEDHYEFRNVDIFNPVERQKLKELSPLLKIPILEFDKQILWDSRVIFNFLCQKGYHGPLTLNEENHLTAISDVSDSFVQKLLGLRSQLTLPVGTPIEISHRERIENTLNYLESQTQSGAFQTWNFVSISLYCLVDWIQFRDLANLTSFASLRAFTELHKTQPRISQTDPRLKL